MSIADRIFRAVLWALTLPVAALPIEAERRFGAFWGRVFFHALSSRRAVAVENISLAVESGAISITSPAWKIARNSFENLGRNAVDMLKVYHRLDGDIMDRTVIRGVENYNLARSKGPGIIVVTGHCGNWELLVHRLAVLLSPFSFLAQRLRNPSLNQFIEDIRTRHGGRVIYPQGVAKAMIRELRKGHVVGMLIDQAMLDSEGCLIRFLGRPAVSTRLPSLLARKTGALLLPSFCHRDETGGFVITFLPECPLSQNPDLDTAVREDMQHLADSIATFIGQHPDQWLWGHRRWKNVTGLFPEIRQTAQDS